MARTSVVATSGWTRPTTAKVAEAEAAVVEVAVVEVEVAVAGGATATSRFDLCSCADHPDPLKDLGRSGWAETDRAAT